MIIILTTLLILLCLVVVLLILIQRTSGGMGSALGGGAADQVLGAGSAAQLTKLTVWGILGFFILAVLLYVTYQGQVGEVETLQRTGAEMKSDPASPVDSTLPDVPVPPAPESTPVPTPEPETVPVIPGEKAPETTPVPSEGNKSE